MKTLLLGLCLLLGFLVMAQPYNTTTALTSIDYDGDGQIDAKYQVFIIPDTTTLVFTGFKADETFAYLTNAANSFKFGAGESIGSQNKEFRQAGELDFTLDDYGWYFSEVTQRIVYFRIKGSGLFPTETNVLVGLRFLGGDSEQHHAWIRLTRPNNKAGTAYQVAGYDYNPVPGEPIPAGLPPPAPELLAALEPDGNLRLSWDAKYEPYYKLQGRADLSDPDGWLDLPNVFGHTFPVLPDGPTAFFRLARR